MRAAPCRSWTWFAAGLWLSVSACQLPPGRPAEDGGRLLDDGGQVVDDGGRLLDDGGTCCGDPTCPERLDEACGCKQCGSDSVCSSGLCRAFTSTWGYCLQPTTGVSCTNAAAALRVEVALRAGICAVDGGFGACAWRHDVDLSAGTLSGQLDVNLGGGVTVTHDAGTVAAPAAVQAWRDAVDAGLWCEPAVASWASMPCVFDHPGIAVVASGEDDAGVSLSWPEGPPPRPSRPVLHAVGATLSTLEGKWPTP